MTKLDDIRKRHAAATPGPWHLLDECRVWSVDKSEPLVTETYTGFESDDDDWDKEQDNAEAAAKRGAANADFIAASWEDVRWMVEQIEKLHVALADLKAAAHADSPTGAARSWSDGRGADLPVLSFALLHSGAVSITSQESPR